MKKIAILSFCLALFISANVVFAALTADKIDEILDLASEAYDDGLLNKATNYLNLILKEEPKHPEANKAWKQYTGKVYVAPKPKMKYPKKNEINSIVSNNINTILDEARYNILLRTQLQTKFLISNKISSLPKDQEFNKEIQDIIDEAVSIEKQRIVNSIRESLDLTNVVQKKEVIKMVVITNIVKESVVLTNKNTVDTADNKEKARQLYDRAMKILDEEKYEETQRLLEQAKILDPDNENINKTLKKVQAINNADK